MPKLRVKKWLIKLLNAAPGDIACCYANPALAKKLLGWQAEHGVQEMCDDTWRWQSNNPMGYKSHTELEQATV